jgi:hypothetical protein
MADSVTVEWPGKKSPREYANGLTNYIINNFEGKPDRRKVEAFIRRKELLESSAPAAIISGGAQTLYGVDVGIDPKFAPVIIQSFHALKKPGRNSAPTSLAAAQDLYDYYICVPKGIMNIEWYDALHISEEILDPSGGIGIGTFLEYLSGWYEKYYKMLTLGGAYREDG